MNFLALYLKELTKNAESIGNALDIMYCTFKYGASPVNYAMFGFKNLAAKQRATYVTNRVSRQMIKKYNAAAFIDTFEDKAKFAATFAEFFSRDYLVTDNLSWPKFKAFIDHIISGGGFVALFASRMEALKAGISEYMRTGLMIGSCLMRLL